MKESRQTTQTKDRDFLVEFDVAEQNHTASWSRFDEGYATFNARVHKRAGWLSLVMVESAKSTRQTMMTLTPESAKALYEFLHAQYGKSAT